MGAQGGSGRFRESSWEFQGGPGGVSGVFLEISGDSGGGGFAWVPGWFRVLQTPPKR